MTEHPRTERRTQDRVVSLFTEASHPRHLGYRYLGELGRRETERCEGWLNHEYDAVMRSDWRRIAQ